LPQDQPQLNNSGKVEKRELALSCGILDLKNMQRDKLTSDPKYFETCLTSLYSYITYHTDKHKPFTTPE